MQIKLGDKLIGDGCQTYVIAELASAHCGSLELAKEILQNAAEAGCDAVKLQRFHKDRLIVPSDQRYENFKKIELSAEDWEKLILFAKGLKVDIIGEPYDEEAADFFQQHNVVAFKIPSSDVTNPYLVKKVASFGKPILIAVGGSSLEEIKTAVDLIKSNGNETISLMHGYQAFPTKIEDTNLAAIETLKKEFNLPVGFSDHVDASSEIAVTLSALAIAHGASVIEKHITKNRADKGFDHYSSLHKDEFVKMVSLIRNYEKAIGSGKITEYEAEQTYRKKMKKYVVAARNISAGEVIKLEDLAFKRNQNEAGLPPSEAEKIIGKTVKAKISENELIKLEKVAF